MPITNKVIFQNSNGNVGIGNNSPAHTLRIEGTLSATGNANLGNIGATNISGTLITAAQPNITSLGTLSSLTVSGNAAFDSNTLFVDSVNDRIGIGTTTPRQKLDIAGGFLYLSSGSQIQITGNPGTVGLQMLGSDTAESIVGTMGAHPLVFRTNSTEQVRITNSGNVLIGTSTDDGSNRLQISGNVKLSSSAGAIIRTEDTSSGTTAAKIETGAGYTTVGTTTNHPYILATNNTEALRIYPTSQNINIGSSVSDSGFKLNVTGTGSSGTARFYDQTASTGVTKVVVRGGAGQSSSNSFEIQNNSGTAMFYIQGNNGAFVSTGTAQIGNTVDISFSNSNSMFVRSNILIGWSSNATLGTASDTAMARNAAGVVEINNGTAGTYRDLYSRSQIMYGAGTGVKTLIVRGNSSNDANIQEWQNSAGTVLASINGSGFLTTPYITGNPSNSYFTLQGNDGGLTLRNTALVRWISGTDAASGTPDLSLARNAAGVLEINNGTAGTLRDLKLRTINAQEHTWGSIVSVFGQPKYKINELTDVLAKADARFTVTGGSNVYFDGNYDSPAQLPLNTTTTININVANQSGVPAAGITYPEGKIYVSFYYTSNAYTSITLRTRHNGTWYTAAAPSDISTNSGYKVLEFSVTGANYLTDIELSIVVGSSECWLSSINYYCDRWTTELELPYFSKYLDINRYFGTFVLGSNNLGLTTSQTQHANNRMLVWSSTSNYSGAQDVGLSRNSAGILEINSSVPGTYRDLIVRDIFKSGTSVKAVWGGENLTTAGSIPYVSASGVLSQDSTKLFWDSTNSYLYAGSYVSASNYSVRLGTGNSEIYIRSGAGWMSHSGSMLVVASTSATTLAATTFLQLNANNVEAARFATTTSNFLLGTSTDGNFRLDVAKSGSSGTARFYDQTATTGVTTVVIRAGAGQSSTNLTEWQNSGGTAGVWVMSAGTSLQATAGLVIGGGSGAFSAGYYTAGLDLSSAWSINWSSTTAANGAKDLSISRASAGVLEINNGTAGTLRDLIARNVKIGSTTGTNTLQFGTAGTNVVDYSGTLTFQAGIGQINTGWGHLFNVYNGDGTAAAASISGNTAGSQYVLDIARSGISGTARFYDATATTGVTKVVVRAGAGQSSTRLQEWQNNAGTVDHYIGLDDFYFKSAQILIQSAYTGAIKLNNNSTIGWVDGVPSLNSLDTAFARNSAGVIEINNGTAGTFRDLLVRTLLGSTGAGGSLELKSTNGNVNRSGIVIGSLVNSDNGGIDFSTAGASTETIRARISGTTGSFLIGTTTDGNFLLDVAKSGSAGTARFYDQTATTGATKVVVRAGAGQSSTNLTEWQNSSGNVIAKVESSGRITTLNDLFVAGTARGAVIGPLPTQFSSGQGIAIGYNNPSDGSVFASHYLFQGASTVSSDLGISRNAAGVLEINNGTAGTFRDLKLRTLIHENTQTSTLTHSNLTTSETAVDTTATATYRSAKYIVQATYGTDYQVSEILLIHNGTTADISEYGITHTSASPIVTYSTDVSGGNMRLLATAAAGSTTNLKIHKISINT